MNTLKTIAFKFFSLIMTSVLISMQSNAGITDIQKLTLNLFGLLTEQGESAIVLHEPKNDISIEDCLKEINDKCIFASKKSIKVIASGRLLKVSQFKEPLISLPNIIFPTKHNENIGEGAISFNITEYQDKKEPLPQKLPLERINVTNIQCVVQ